ncbi:gas vesicle protein GvpG [Streptomyces anulatus]|uniref:gas vesicle protein GvpG n=1 Tax=Streptomyces anulatus TaxID=1892 RepID=UPI00363AC1F1
MGLISNILTLPLAPVRGTVWVLDQVIHAAQEEYYDPEPIRARLAQLEQDLNNGLIDAEEFDRLEDELLDRLDEIEDYRNTTRHAP